MKKVFLYAYDKKNLGDDLFVHMITKRYPHVRFYLWTKQSNRPTYRSLTNLKVLTKDDWWIRILGRFSKRNTGRIKRIFERSADAVVYIGGSIFMEYPKWKNILNWWNYTVDRYPCFVLGANFGPYASEEYREAVDAVLAKTQDTCFRDLYSKNLFAGNQKVRYAPDILFAYPIPSVEKKEHKAFFSIIDCTKKEEGGNHLAQYDDAYVHFVANRADRLIEDGWDVVFSSFCRQEGDENGIEKVLREMSHSDSVRFCHYDGTNADLVLHTLSESELVYGTRFHAVIIGISAACKVVPIIYSDKTRHVLEDLSFTGPVFDIRTMDSSEPCHTIQEAEVFDRGRYAEIKEGAEGHFRCLDRMLSKP